MKLLSARPVMAAAPLGDPPSRVRSWFDDAASAQIPNHDGTIGTARLATQAYARHAKADKTRRAYRTGVRAWCGWCDQHTLPCMPARSDDVVAFLTAERGRGLSVNTIDLRRVAIRYLHFIAGCAVPSAEAHVAETMAAIHREAANRGELPATKLRPPPTSFGTSWRWFPMTAGSARPGAAAGRVCPRAAPLRARRHPRRTPGTV